MPITSADRSRFLLAAAALGAVLALGFAFILSYVAALHDPRPHELPVAVAGPPRAVAEVQRALGAGRTFEVLPRTDERAARAALDSRDAYGALVLRTGGTDRLLLADAAGPNATALVEQAARRLAARQGRRLEVAHVHPLQPGDFRGLSSFYAVVGWAFAGYVAAIVLAFVTGPSSLSAPRAGLRLLGLAIYAIAAGLLGAIAVGPILGAIDGHFWALWGIGAFTTMAAAAATAALQAAVGLAGTFLALLAFVVVGNPSAGGVFPPELMPGFFRAVGAWLPNGAGFEALRNLVYFDGAALGRPLGVLGGYVGVAALVLGAVALVRERPPRLRVGLQTD